MIVVALLAGAGIGFGAWLAWRAVHPAPPPLTRVLAGFGRPGMSVAELDAGGIRSDAGWSNRLGETTLAFLDGAGLVDTGELARRLRVLDVSPERHAFNKLLSGVTGFAIPILFGLLLAAGGVSVPAGFLGLAALVLALVGFFYPDLGLTEQVERRRRGFRHALSAYLDLVTIILAGGGGLETALQSAADAGEGWAFTELRRGLHRARLSGTTPWEAFDGLGSELGVDELRELAASAYLAGDQGARIKASLAAKADSMRATQTAAIEAQAEAATEKMLLPVVGLVVGMILFIGFGVVQAISTPSITP